MDENYVFKTMDKIMQQATMHDFCKSIEIFFAELFNCERVNVVLVHRFKKFLYRIEQDTKPGTFKMTKYDLQAGIAGYVCISSHSVISVPEIESKFRQDIDDPKGNSPPIQILSCPVNAPDDFSQMNKEGLASLPRAII